MFKQVLDDLDEHLHTSQHFRFLWFPHTNCVSISHASRVYDVQITKYTLIESAVNWLWNYGIGYYGLELAYWISSHFPVIVPVVNRLAFNLLYSKPTQQIDVSHKIFNFECLFKQHVNEWSIPT